MKKAMKTKFESSPMHLFLSLVMAAVVMNFLNLVLGTMGGIPSFVGMLVAFFFAWARVNGRALEKGEKTETTGLFVGRTFAGYLLEYFVLWFSIKGAMVFTNLWGWGEGAGLSLKEYLEAIYGTTLVEQWAHIFAMIFMVSYIICLFPMVFIQKKKWAIWYLVGESIVFWLFGKLIIAVCCRWIPKEQRAFIANVSDAMNMCVTEERWQAGVFIVIAALLFLWVSVTTIVLAFRVMRNGPHETLRKYKNILLVIAGILTVVLLVVSWYDVLDKHKKPLSIGEEPDTQTEYLEDSGQEDENVGPEDQDEEEEYEKVAQFLTGDTNFAPMEYNGQIYIPMTEMLSYEENGIALGYITYKDQDLDSWFGQNTKNLLYAGLDGNLDTLEMSGVDQSAFRLASLVEKEEQWRDSSLYVLWDEEWLSETSYSKDRTGYCVCTREWVEALRQAYPSVSYRIEDFEDYDAYFTIRGYQEPKEAFGDEVICGKWVGCIFVKDNAFYFGSYENPIEGILLEELLNTLGGYDAGNPEEYEAL